MLVLVGCQTGPTAPAENLDAQFVYVGRDSLPDQFDAQGHRGARGLLPESTLPSFEAALDLGVSTLELDLHYTQDGQVIVWHDPIISKDKCQLPEDNDGQAPDPRNPLRRVFVSQNDLAIIQNYQCDLNPEPSRFPDQAPLEMPLAGQDYRIVTLQELFDFVALYAQSELKTESQRANAAVVEFNIETKRKVDNPEYIGDGFTGGTAGPFELAILEIVAANNMQDRTVIQSFDHRSLQVIREINTDIRLAALTSSGEAKVKVYNGYQFDIWSPRARDLTPELLQEAQDLGLKVIPWTINDPDDMQALIDMGVDGIITDRPDLLLQLSAP